ncbi:Glucan endo-1,3-beta-glucosidase [Linum perenne]
MQFKNLCPYPVWPGIMTEGGNGPRLPTGFVVLSNTSEIFEVPSYWTNGRFWGQTGCETSPNGYFHCLTGDCGTGQKTCIDIEPKPWVTYMEFNLNLDGGRDCCTGALDSPELCRRTIVSMELFSEICPEAHSYPFDVDVTNYKCETGKDYLITFCPPIHDHYDQLA